MRTQGDGVGGSKSAHDILLKREIFVKNHDYVKAEKSIKYK